MNEDIGDPEPQVGEAGEVVARLSELQHSLRFVETDEMQQLRPQVVEAMASRDSDRIRKELGQYQELGEELIDSLAPSPGLEKIIKAASQKRLGSRTPGEIAEFPDMLPDEQLDHWLRVNGQIALTVATATLWKEAGRTEKYGNNILMALMVAKKEGRSEAVRILRASFEELIQLVDITTHQILAASLAELPEELHQEIEEQADLPPGQALEVIAEIMEAAKTDQAPYDFFQQMGWVKG